MQVKKEKMRYKYACKCKRKIITEVTDNVMQDIYQLAYCPTCKLVWTRVKWQRFQRYFQPWYLNTKLALMPGKIKGLFQLAQDEELRRLNERVEKALN